MPNFSSSQPGPNAPDLDATARRVIDANVYMTLATRDAAGRPQLSPVYYTAARYTDFYWVSAPQARHSLQLAAYPDVEIVIFDSTVRVGAAEAVYLAATARQVSDDELDTVLAEAFRTSAGARQFAAGELRDTAPFRLYVAHLTACEVLLRGSDPANARGTDARYPAHPGAGR